MVLNLLLKMNIKYFYNYYIYNSKTGKINNIIDIPKEYLKQYFLHQ